MDPWLVVGLGNPGPTYATTRHNLGAMTVSELARRHTGSLRSHKARAAVAEVRFGLLPGGAPGPRVILAIPSSYMNESGGPVKALCSFFSVPVEQLVVVHDELDVVFGQVRLKRGGGDAGHNGLRSVSSALGTRDYARVRVGIGRPPGRMDPADYVLRDFSSTQRPDVPFLVGEAADAVESLVLEGLSAAQQHFHAP
jgi:PTH1 family peptidyl-tRNA hydrolase